jgi:uncharacterized protein with PQ loop repeat
VVLFVGDVASLIGSIWAKLVPTVIVIAVYICIADTVLVCQCLYYNARNARRSRRLSDDLPTPTTPLLGRQISDDLSLPESRRRRSSASLRGRHPRLAENALAGFVGESGSGRSAWVNNLLSVLAICVIGSAGWAMAWRTGVWTPTPAGSGGGATRTVGSQILGYISAICYLSGRIPQIYKNYIEKSCEGLSLLFFILSLTGNLAYGGGILFHSTDRDYIITTLPWLIGSLGTMAQDVWIFIQFRIYATNQIKQ